ncbi:MAG: hypothetical protein ACFFCG_09645 [Promethearchaeota archaeon]
MILYIWKIIDLPYINRYDLEYKISFELFLFSPKKAKEFVEKAIHNGFLLAGNNSNLSLSDDLVLELKNWHIKRREEILKKLKISAIIAQKRNDFKKNGTSKFNILLKAFLDSGTINRAVQVSDDAILIKTFDPQGKYITAEIKGSQKTPYLIEISAYEKFLKHDCHDFQTKRAQNKKFCKHLAKLFLILKEKDEKIATLILDNISKDINKWDFIF